MASQPCDFCGAPVEWTADQIALDIQLKLLPHCEGLGVVCDSCSDARYAMAVAEMEREERREREDRDGA